MNPVRQGARILVLDPDKFFLMFHFAYSSGPLAGTDYWGMPGGGVEQGETIAEAACRELFEETGLRVNTLGEVVAESTYPFRLSSGRDVLQHDYYFVLHLTKRMELSKDNCTPEEVESMCAHRWWNLEQIKNTHETIIPVDLPVVLNKLLK